MIAGVRVVGASCKDRRADRGPDDGFEWIGNAAAVVVGGGDRVDHFGVAFQVLGPAAATVGQFVLVYPTRTKRSPPSARRCSVSVK